MVTYEKKIGLYQAHEHVKLVGQISEDQSRRNLVSIINKTSSVTSMTDIEVLNIIKILIEGVCLLED